ncbi:MAG: PH domain-containing protein [Clostridiales bacterium]|nr:PH domain-containing protein [Clostridiales bacterium]
MMFFIMLPCYLIVIAAFAYTMNSAAKPNGYILLGVKLPKQEMNRLEIQNMVKKFKKRNRYLTIGMFITTALAFFLRAYPIISTLYCLLLIGLWLVAMWVLLVKTFDEVYAYKKEQGWTVGDTYSISVDTEVARLKKYFPYSKWHWLAVLVLTVIGCFLWKTEDAGGIDYVYMAVNAVASVALFGIYSIVPKVKSNIYSENSEINVALNRCYCYEMTKAMVLAAYINAVSWLIGGIFPEPIYNYSLVLAIVILSSILNCAVIFIAMNKVKKERNLLMQVENSNFEIDDDIYWRGGIYKNPNDPKLWVEKRFGFGLTMNMAHSAGKVMDVIVTIIMVGCLAMLIHYVPLDFPSLSLTMDSDKIYINATQYDTEINFSDITEASILTELPKLYKNSGLANATYDFGKFRAKEYGQSRVYINKEQPKRYLLIYTEDSMYFINSDHAEELEACITELQKRNLLNE